jgi:hypothetical protein
MTEYSGIIPPSGSMPTEREAGVSSQLPPVLMACLSAAKGYGLIRKQASKVCPLSRETDLGWWARANWSEFQADSEKGGPWPVETVAHLCGLGLLGIHPDSASRAKLTKLGSAKIKVAKPKVNQSVSSSTCGICEANETITSNKEGKTNG